jgi:glutamate formiminotransferase/glutamate formiminotransferase/formiminotetrahydrofolate cyclodeaminase
VPPLLAVPNVSEGRDAARISALEAAFSEGIRLLDRHSDADHDRTVFTLAAGANEPAGGEEALVEALLAGAEAATGEIDMSAYDGLHPAVGALDVCPIVWLDPADRDAAATAAVAAAEGIGALGVPVFLYGELAGGPERRERAYFRNGGLAELWLRMESGELVTDQGPAQPHPRAGATQVTSRPPLPAYNVELARSVAAGLREAGGGLPGVRAIGLALGGGRGQVSTNVHDPATTPLALVVERVRALAAPLGARPVEAELVGLIPEVALAGYPHDVPIRGFDPGRHTIERRLEGIEGQPPPATD